MIFVKRLFPLSLLFLVSILSIQIVLASVGVGVGIGSVKLTKPLQSGGVYRIVSLPVVNTGDEAGNYTVIAEAVSMPVGVKSDSVSPWFSVSPKNTDLKPKQSTNFDISLTLPFDAPEGPYIIFLEATPLKTGENNVTINAAAATKLYFNVESGSVLVAVKTRITTFILTRPEIYLLAAAILLIEAFLILRRNFRIVVKNRTNNKSIS